MRVYAGDWESSASLSTTWGNTSAQNHHVTHTHDGPAPLTFLSSLVSLCIIIMLFTNR